MANRTLLQTWDLSSTNLTTSGLNLTGIDAYDEILILFDGVVNSAQDDCGIRLSNDGGSSYRSGASDYVEGNISGASAAYTHNKMALDDFMTCAFLPSSGIGAYGEVRIYEPARSSFGTVMTANMQTTYRPFGGFGSCQTAEVNDALKILVRSGTASTGTIRVYGVTYNSSYVTTLLNRNFAVTSLSQNVGIPILNIDDYDEIWWRASNLVNSSASGALHIGLSNDGGSTYEHGASAYNIAYFNSGRAVTANNNFQGIAQGDQYVCGAGHLSLHNTSSAKTVGRCQAAGDTVCLASASERATAELNDAMEFIARNGNFTSGKLVVYGVTYG